MQTYTERAKPLSLGCWDACFAIWYFITSWMQTRSSPVGSKSTVVGSTRGSSLNESLRKPSSKKNVTLREKKSHFAHSPYIYIACSSKTTDKIVQHKSHPMWPEGTLFLTAIERVIWMNMFLLVKPVLFLQ